MSMSRLSLVFYFILSDDLPTAKSCNYRIMNGKIVEYLILRDAL